MKNRSYFKISKRCSTQNTIYDEYRYDWFSDGEMYQWAKDRAAASTYHYKTTEISQKPFDSSVLVSFPGDS